mmetsp:Transcript_5423/g.7992  ORF Transcript_5423/g.7992 Transcript_5423/m.7992 type:complete len:282 (+) Transcript_5423:192-1037(+)
MMKRVSNSFLFLIIVNSNVEALPNIFGSLTGICPERIPRLSDDLNYCLGITSQRTQPTVHLVSYRCPWFPVFASAIYLKCEALNCCFGFLDGTFLRICRPSRDGYRGFWQRLFYSGYKHQHGLLFQGLSLPNGILALMHGPYPGGVYNDLSMLEMSGILEMLWSFTEINGVRYFLYGDRGYSIEPGLIPPFPRASSMSDREKIFNSRMSSVRVSVEWTFGKIKSLFPFLDVAHKLRIGSMPLGSHYLIATLLTNCHSCLYGSESAQYFNCPAPELEYYMRE